MLQPTMTEDECRKRMESSPIRCLMERVVRRPYEMVPERSLRLMQMTEQAGVEYAFTLEESAIVQIEDPLNKIVINLEEAERLWAALYAYASIFDLTVKRGGPGVIEIALSKAQGDWIWMEALGWALGRRRPGDSGRRPDSLPKPENDAEQTVWKTNEWFVDVLGFMVLHEFGHLASQHFQTLATLRTSRPNGAVLNDYLKMEFEADDWAAAWMMEPLQERGLDAYSPEFIRRSTTCAMAFAVLACNEVENRTWGGARHPDPMKRLLAFLDKYVGTKGRTDGLRMHPAWTLAVIILQAHLTEKKVPISRFQCCREALIDAIRLMNLPA
jgi:hypothetical protein